MDRLLTKKEIKFYNKLEKNIFARHTKFFRRNVHLNHKETHLRIIRIKTDDQFYDEVKGFLTLPDDICFFIHHVNPLKDKYIYYSVKDSDCIITDCTTNKVISINQKLKKYPHFFNI